MRICGSGEQEELLKNKAQKLGIADSVIFTPMSPRIADYYSNASIMALTSHYEGFPLSLVEGQHMGLPIVAYDCLTGPSEIISDGRDGYLVPIYDKEAFAEVLVKLIDGNDLRAMMSQEAIKASERFDKDKIMQQWMDLFDELVGEKA